MTPSVTVVLSATSPDEIDALLGQWRSQRYPAEELHALVTAPAGVPVAEQPRVQRMVRAGRHAADINQALAVAQTDYLVFADATLELDPDWVAALVKEARASWRVVAVTSKMYARGRWIASVGTGLARGYRWYDRGSSEEDIGQYDENREVYGITLNGSLLDRSYVRTGSGLDEDFTTTYADIDLSIRIVAAGYRLRLAPGATCRRPLGPPGADRNPDPPTPVAEWERLFIIARHYPDLLADQIALAAPALAATSDPKPQLARLLDKWIATSSNPEARERCFDRILSDPTHLHDHLRSEWQQRVRG